MNRPLWPILLPLLLLLGALMLASQAWSQESCAAMPSHGAPSVTVAHATSVCHKGYVSVVDDDLKIPRYVAYELTAPHSVGCNKRQNNFHVDPALPDGSAAPADYAQSGFDKGHQAPAEDFAWDAGAMSDSFSMANMAPQVPGLNRQEWERLEETVRSWALDRGPLSIYVGPYLGKSKTTIGKHHVLVPEGYWKIIVDAKGESQAYFMWNTSIAKGPLDPFMAEDDKLAALTGVTIPHSPNSTTPWSIDLANWRQKHQEACK